MNWIAFAVAAYLLLWPAKLKHAMVAAAFGMFFLGLGIGLTL